MLLSPSSENRRRHREAHMVLFSCIHFLFICQLIFHLLLSRASLRSATIWPAWKSKKEEGTEQFSGHECSLSNHRTVHLSVNCYRSQAYREKQTSCGKPSDIQSSSSVRSNLIQLDLIDPSTLPGLNSSSETSSACLDT